MAHYAKIHKVSKLASERLLFLVVAGCFRRELFPRKLVDYGPNTFCPLDDPDQKLIGQMPEQIRDLLQILNWRKRILKVSRLPLDL